MAEAGKRIAFSGRVRAGGTMPRPTGKGRCVLATTWASDRPFPRTAGQAIPFDVETATGDIYAVDPSEAAVTLGVRTRDVDAADGAARETSWLAPGEDVAVEGDAEPPIDGQPTLVRAQRILAQPRGALAFPPHSLPPRRLDAGTAEQDPGHEPTIPSDPAVANLLAAAARPRRKKPGP